MVVGGRALQVCEFLLHVAWSDPALALKSHPRIHCGNDVDGHIRSSYVIPTFIASAIDRTDMTNKSTRNSCSVSLRIWEEAFSVTKLPERKHSR